MAADSKSTLSFLMDVMNRFGTKESNYSEFLQIFIDFNNKVDGDEIIRRAKELFNGDERLVMGYYNVLLDQKRKKKKQDDFGEAFKFVYAIMTSYQNNEDICKSFLEILHVRRKNETVTHDAYQEADSPFGNHPKALEEFAYFLPCTSKASSCCDGKHSVNSRLAQRIQGNHNSHVDSSDFGAGYSNQRRCVETERMEDTCKTECEKNEYSGHNCRKLDSIQSVGERGDNLASSSDPDNNMTEYSWNDAHADKFLKAENGGRFWEQNISEREKSRNLERKRDKINRRLDKELSSIPSNTASKKSRSFTANGSGPISELNLSVCGSCTPSYRLLPKEVLEFRKSSRSTRLDALVLNDYWVSVDHRGKYSHKKEKEKEKTDQYIDDSCVSVDHPGKYSQEKEMTDQYTEVLLKLEDDMFELDMVLESVRATINKVEIMMMPKKEDDLKKEEDDFTYSNKRCIKQLYGLDGLDVIPELLEISRDLKMWEETLKESRGEFHSLARSVFDEMRD